MCWQVHGRWTVAGLPWWPPCCSGEGCLISYSLYGTYPPINWSSVWTSSLPCHHGKVGLWSRGTQQTIRTLSTRKRQGKNLLTARTRTDGNNCQYVILIHEKCTLHRSPTSCILLNPGRLTKFTFKTTACVSNVSTFSKTTSSVPEIFSFISNVFWFWSKERTVSDKNYGKHLKKDIYVPTREGKVNLGSKFLWCMVY